MALFSLLIAILVERLNLLAQPWQSDRILGWYQSHFFGEKQLQSVLMVVIAIIFPAVCVYVVSWAIAGLFWGALTLLLWVSVAIVCFSHRTLRAKFRQYVLAACRGDTQACYNYAKALDEAEDIDAISEHDLGMRVGQTVSWLNYRYYGAVALYFIIFGPVGAVLYCTVRYYDELNLRKQLAIPLLSTLVFILDWIPSRIVAFGYALSGRFNQAFPVWVTHALAIKTPARDIIVRVAVAAEELPPHSSAPVCVQSTLALLQLSKRNTTLIITVLSLLTIFGFVS